MNVEFHPAALREVEQAQGWYEERSVFAASAFLRELSTAVRRVREAPQRIPLLKLERVALGSSGFRSPSTSGSTSEP